MMKAIMKGGLFVLLTLIAMVSTDNLDNTTLKLAKLEARIASLETKTSSAYCKLLSPNICGSCTCFDDYRVKQKYYCDCQHLPSKKDCLAFYQAGFKTSGIYKITLITQKTIQVYCDQTTDGGGWTVIQRRVDGTVNFYRNWQEYKDGFGEYQHEYYIGNDDLNILTLQAIFLKGSELRIDMDNWSKNVYAKYSKFQIGNVVTKYVMHVSGYTGSDGDSLKQHNGRKFSTYDQDNDDTSSTSCAQKYHGGWWYNKDCNLYSNLNGEYRVYGEPKPHSYRGVIWLHSGSVSLKSVEMKVRRIV